jgi:hypothetical protein
MADGENYKMIRDLPEPAIGDVIEFDGKSLTAMKLFKHGKEAQESGLKYFMKTANGVIGFHETTA